jgi:hypothetical protein
MRLEGAENVKFSAPLYFSTYWINSQRISKALRIEYFSFVYPLI